MLLNTYQSSPRSTNEVNTSYGVSTANTQVSPTSTQVSTASTQVTTANLSDATIYAFLTTQPHGKNVGFVSYNVVPPPPRGLFSPLKLDLSKSSLEEFQQPEFEGHGPKTSNSVSEYISHEVKESTDAPLVMELALDDKLEKKTVFPTITKIEFANCNYRQRERVVSCNNCTRVNYNYSTKKAHPSAHKNMAPRAVLMKTGLRPLNTARPVNTAHPKPRVYSARPIYMTRNMSYLSEYEGIDGGYVALGGDPKGGKITGKGMKRKFMSTRKELRIEFEKMMHKKFQISSMGELTFFLGLQVTQKDDKIFIIQDKEEQVQSLMDKKKVIITETSRKQKTKKPRRKDTELPQTSVPIEVVADKVVYEEMYDSVERAATTATVLDADGEDRLKLSELMELYTQLQSRVLTLETTKTNQASDIGSIKRRVKKLEKKASKRTYKLKRLYKIGSSRRIESSDEASLGDEEVASKQGRIIHNLDADEGVTLVDETQRRNDQDMFDTSVLNDEKVIAKKEVSTVDPVTTTGELVTTAGVEVSTATTTPTISMDDITLAKALAALKSSKPMVNDPSVPKAKGIILQELEETAIRTTTTVPSQDHELAERLQVEEQGELTIEESIDAIPLTTKPPIIIDRKIIKEGKISFYHIIRPDGNSNRFSSMIQMLQNIDIKDLETLWKLVKAKYVITRQEEASERVLWGELKVVFEPDIESEAQRNLQGNKVTVWKLFYSCGVHFVRFQNLHILMLVGKRYPLTPATITEMLNRKLQADHLNEMCY
nr:ribonuclease H-like domain-containing protein [Tanacetum cinerariifolium]